jgi:hypothetical protein
MLINEVIFFLDMRDEGRLMKNFVYLCYSLLRLFKTVVTTKPSNRGSEVFFSPPLPESRDSSVGIALGYGLDDRGSRVRLPAGAGNFSLHHRVQNGSGAHPASYQMGTRVSFPGGKAVAV